MTSDEIVALLKRNKSVLQAHGVVHAALFGSRARGIDREDSDTDILIELDPEAGISVFDYVGLRDYISSLIEGPVDVVNRDSLKASIARAAIAGAIYAF